jgi:GTP-binding protein HflX
LVVLDANSQDLYNEIETIKEVLNEIGAKEIDVQYIFNKIDLVDQEKIFYLKNLIPEAILVSAERSLQISKINESIKNKFESWIKIFQKSQ